jgi:hypothetical protein
MTDAELLRGAIDRSGLSARAFAVRVLIRDERTVRRWLAGDSPIPAVVVQRLREMAEIAEESLDNWQRERDERRAWDDDRAEREG